MSIVEMFLGEFDQEMTGTRKMLERFPDSKASWKPHEKSFSMSQLAGHVAELPDFFSKTAGADSYAMTAAEYKPFVPKSAGEAVARFDEESRKARAAIAKLNDTDLATPWSFIYEGKTYFTMPRGAVLRGFCMNHIIHHRAQLTVYYRMNDVPVPGLYGPSADEPG